MPLCCSGVQQPLFPKPGSSGTSALAGTETWQSIRTDMIEEAEALDSTCYGALDCAHYGACCPPKPALMSQVSAGMMLPSPVRFGGLGDPVLGLSPAGMQWARMLIVP